MSAFSSPFAHWPQKFPRPIIVAPVVRGYGGWAVPFSPSSEASLRLPGGQGKHAPILTEEGAARRAGSRIQEIGEAGANSQIVGVAPPCAGATGRASFHDGARPLHLRWTGAPA